MLCEQYNLLLQNFKFSKLHCAISTFSKSNFYTKVGASTVKIMFTLDGQKYIYILISLKIIMDHSKMIFLLRNSTGEGLTYHTVMHLTSFFV